MRLEAKEIPVGPYNLPDWDGTREGMHLCLDGLYQLTPPAALLIDGASIFAATQQDPSGLSHASLWPSLIMPKLPMTGAGSLDVAVASSARFTDPFGKLSFGAALGGGL